MLILFSVSNCPCSEKKQQLISTQCVLCILPALANAGVSVMIKCCWVSSASSAQNSYQIITHIALFYFGRHEFVHISFLDELFITRNGEGNEAWEFYHKHLTKIQYFYCFFFFYVHIWNDNHFALYPIAHLPPGSDQHKGKEKKNERRLQENMDIKENGRNHSIYRNHNLRITSMLHLPVPRMYEHQLYLWYYILLNVAGSEEKVDKDGPIKLCSACI